MKVYKLEEVPPRPAGTRKVCVARSCDLCGKKAEGGDEWSGGSYSVDETEVTVTLECKVGSRYPECGSWTEWEVDLCPACFVGKLVPWLNGQGASIKPREVET